MGEHFRIMSAMICCLKAIRKNLSGAQQTFATIRPLPLGCLKLALMNNKNITMLYDVLFIWSSGKTPYANMAFATQTKGQKHKRQQKSNNK